MSKSITVSSVAYVHTDDVDPENADHVWSVEEIVALLEAKSA